MRITCCRRMVGHFAWDSVVSHSRKFLSADGSRALSSFSKLGSQATTRCTFLRQSHSPASALLEDAVRPCQAAAVEQGQQRKGGETRRCG